MITTQEHKHSKTLILFFILLIVPIGQVAIDIYLPSLPHISQELTISTSATQWSLTIYLLSSGISQFFYGPISDSLGRKPILCCGLTIFFIGSLVTALAQGEASLLLGRLLQGLGIGAGRKRRYLGRYFALPWCKIASQNATTIMPRPSPSRDAPCLNSAHSASRSQMTLRLV